LVRYPVQAVVHGHAHNGAPEGRARGDTPVYNVSLPLLRKSYPDRPPFRLLEVRVSGAAAGPNGAPAGITAAPTASSA
jgi:hypothetical protein